MGGGAWPFLVGGAICLVNSVNERDLGLLTSYVEVTSTAGFLEGLWPFRPRKFEAITVSVMPLDVRAHARYSDVFNELLALADGLVSASHRLALTTSPPFVHTARRSYRLNGPVKCSDRGDAAVRRRRRREKSTEPYHLEEGEVVTRFP
ncbi:hypothetical protein Syun_006778 [Stephania yunnanensis]|uniref:Uncharacterized protein n=1 Tax=Stephania yunnanensis TaxID=152371 RepID=A0AAP0KX62_9MAGN